jgi:catechol 2,3-dioxygenase-like lactoylglutathione lyase family enzyme
MRLDHIAYRVCNRDATALFFDKCLGYRIAEDLPQGFKVDFDDGSNANCYVLLPPEELIVQAPWSAMELYRGSNLEYHKPPEIFVSQGSPGSIVDQWVKKRDDVGGIHHLAYQVESVEETMLEWTQKGYAEFTTKEPLTCPGLVQCFTKPSILTGVIYEFIERDTVGFCKDNVKNLMNSTRDL